ncbi:MAG TPA: hypothetical protein VIV34_09320 [Pseudolabrys sp.]
MYGSLDPPDKGGQTVEQTALEQADGTWLVNGITLAQSGIWTTRVIVRRSRGDLIVLDAPIVIER